jgi:Putative ABC exporter
VFVALCWALRRQRAALSFSEAEIAFLFPAPVGRPALIHYRLISAALASLFTALILSLVSRRWGDLSPHAAIRFAGWWLIFSTISLHTIGSGFVITRWQDRGISPLACQLMAWGAIAVLVGAPLLWLWFRVQAGTGLSADVFEHGPVSWLLYPFRLLLAPLLARSAPDFAQAFWPAALLYAAHYWWVLHVQVGFEEASIAKAEKRAQTIAAIRAGTWRAGQGGQKARRAPFDLQRAGRPELAFLWKNLLSTSESLRLRNALIAAAVMITAHLLLAEHGFYQFLRPFLAMAIAVIAGYVMVFGPQIARQDLRRDLPNTDILKTYPLRGWQIALGEVLTPAAIITVILWLMLLAVALLIPDPGSQVPWFTPGFRVAAALGLALMVPLLCLTQLLIANTAVVVFPAWLQSSATRGPQGIEVMGQRILMMIGQILALTLMMVPVAIVAALVFFVARMAVGDMIAAGLAVVLGAGIMTAEIAGGVWLLGQRFDKLDLSQELRP